MMTKESGAELKNVKAGTLAALAILIALAAILYFRFLGLIIALPIVLYLSTFVRSKINLSQKLLSVLILGGSGVAAMAFVLAYFFADSLLAEVTLRWLDQNAISTSAIDRVMQLLHGNQTRPEFEFLRVRLSESPTWGALYIPLFFSYLASLVWCAFAMPLILFSANDIDQLTEMRSERLLAGTVIVAFLTACCGVFLVFDSLIVVRKGIGFADLAPFALPIAYWSMFLFTAKCIKELIAKHLTLYRRSK